MTLRPLDTAPSRRPLRIEMVLPSLTAAGMEVMVARLTLALARRGHAVGITCTESGGALVAELRAEGQSVEVVPVPGVHANVFVERLERRFRQLRPDVVHIHSGVWLKAARAARQAGVRCIGHTVHGLLDREPWYDGLLKRWAARNTDWVAAVSEPLRAYLVDRVGIPGEKVCTLQNGIDTDAFGPGPRTGALRASLGIPADAPVVGNVARLAPVKNHLLLLEAVAIARRSVPGLRALLVGEGVERAAIEQGIAELGLQDAVHLAGELRADARVYREFDTFVLSSRAEGTSISLLEAMGTGISVVATAVGGNVALLDGGRCGWLVPSEDPAALAGALAESLGDRAEAAARARLGREHVIQHYSEASMLRRYEELYYAWATGDARLPGAAGGAVACAG